MKATYLNIIILNGGYKLKYNYLLLIVDYLLILLLYKKIENYERLQLSQILNLNIVKDIW